MLFKRTLPKTNTSPIENTPVIFYDQPDPKFVSSGVLE